MLIIKRAVAFALGAAVILSALSASVIAAGAEDLTAAAILGDFDADSMITVFDVSLIQKSLASSSETTAVDHKTDKKTVREDTVTADVDFDGCLTVFDVSLIQKYLVSDTAYREASEIGKAISSVSVEYYLMGVFEDKTNWDVPEEDNKLTESASSPGEFSIVKTFREGDEIRVARVVNGRITAWYKGFADEAYIMEQDKAGKCIVFFRPLSNSRWKYEYLTVARDYR